MQSVIGEGNKILRIDAFPGFPEKEEKVVRRRYKSRKTVNGSKQIDCVHVRARLAADIVWLVELV